MTSNFCPVFACPTLKGFQWQRVSGISKTIYSRTTLLFIIFHCVTWTFFAATQAPHFLSFLWQIQQMHYSIPCLQGCYHIFPCPSFTLYNYRQLYFSAALLWTFPNLPHVFWMGMSKLDMIPQLRPYSVAEELELLLLPKQVSNIFLFCN